MGNPVTDKIDVIANGYAVYYGIADAERSQKILAHYPMIKYGANTVYPQNRTACLSITTGVWPGWEGALMLGAKSRQSSYCRRNSEIQSLQCRHEPVQLRSRPLPDRTRAVFDTATLVHREHSGFLLPHPFRHDVRNGRFASLAVCTFLCQRAAHS